MQSRKLYKQTSLQKNMKLHAKIHFEDGWYVANCMEINTVSQGKTKKEAISNLKEATELYLEEFSETLPALTTFEVKQGEHKRKEVC